MPGPALAYGPNHYLPEGAERYVRYTFIGNYVNYAIASLLVYELVTSLDDEVEHVWPLKWRLPKILFMLNRYFIRALLVCLWILANYPGTSAEFCRIYSYWQMIPLRLAILAAQALVVIRVWAIYNNSRPMLYILSILYACELLAVTGCVVVATIDQQGIAQPAPLSCALKSQSGYLASEYASGTWIAPVCFEFVLILITLFKLAPRWSFTNGLLGSAGNRTLDILARDSLVYFMFIFTFTLANAIVYEVDFTAYYHGLLLGPTSAISCIAVSRMMINIRSAPSPADSVSAMSWPMHESRTYLGEPRSSSDPYYPMVTRKRMRSNTNASASERDVDLAFADTYGGHGDGLGNLPPDVEAQAQPQVGEEEEEQVPGSAKPFLDRSPSSRSRTKRKPPPTDYYAGLPGTGGSEASQTTLVGSAGPLTRTPAGPSAYEPPSEEYVYESGYEAGLRMARERRERGKTSAGSRTSIG